MALPDDMLALVPTPGARSDQALASRAIADVPNAVPATTGRKSALGAHADGTRLSLGWWATGTCGAAPVWLSYWNLLGFHI